MKITVTGAGGFIGGHLVKRLIDDGHEVGAVDIKQLADWWQVHPEAKNLDGFDLREHRYVDIALRNTKADWVYDLAEDMGGVGWLVNNRADGLMSFRIVQNVLEAAQRNDVQRVFFASSACAYNTDLQDTPDVIALAEHHISPAKPEMGYGEAKWMGERLCEYFEMERRVETRVARYHNVMGPHGSWTGGREKSPAALARKVAEAVVSGRHTIDIWGTGEQTRSYCWVDDCVDGTIRLMESDITTPLNIGSSRMVSINQMVDMLEEIAGVTLERTYSPDAPVGVAGRNSDNTLIRRLLGWEPATSLEEGLAQLYPWVEAQVRAKS